MLVLVRYYLAFDKEKILLNFIRNKIISGEIIIVDKVFLESKYIAKSIILKQIDFLSDKDFLKKYKVPYDTSRLFIPQTREFTHQLNEIFVQQVIKRKLTDNEFESQKNNFIESADMTQILLALELKTELGKTIIVTEETQQANDNKLYKKIPSICKSLDIDCWTLPEYLQNSKEISFLFK